MFERTTSVLTLPMYESISTLSPFIHDSPSPSGTSSGLCAWERSGLYINMYIMCNFYFVLRFESKLGIYLLTSQPTVMIVYTQQKS